MSYRYPPEFRRKGLDLLAGGRSVASIAADLGVSGQTIYSWRCQEQIDTGQAGGLTTNEAPELAAAKRRIRQLEAELAVTRHANELLKAKVVNPKVGSRRSHRSPQKDSRSRRHVGCWGVSESGYYEWKSRPPSVRSIHHKWLTGLITQVHADSRGTYGANRVHAELTLGYGIVAGRHQVAMLMARASPGGASRKPETPPARTRNTDRY